MPIYMDRHDVSETVTAENVAQLHQEDLKIQDQFGCRGLTYWFDDKRKTAFCLIEAPNKKTLKEMHNKAHGQVPHRIIEVDASIVESFLGRIEDPEKAQNAALNIINDPAFRTIMVIEVKVILRKLNGSNPVNSLRENYSKLITTLITSYNGKLVRQNEDQYLVSFQSVSNAVDAAFKIQSNLKKINADLKNEKILLKAGLSAGVPVTEKKSIFEDTIKLARRMCKLVKGDIILSNEVKDLYNSENPTSVFKEQNVFVLTQEDENFLNRLMDCIESTWTNANLKVDDFSQPMGFSKSQLYRKIIQLTGKSPNTLVKEYRLNEAMELLNKNGTKNISEIAFETGFTSPSYFSKCFQKRYSQLPSFYLPVKSTN